MENQRLTYSVETPLTPNAFTRPGFTFAGWALSSAGQVAYRDGEAVSDLADEAGAQVDLYAVWTENEYTIVFRGGNGEGSMDNLHLTYTEQTTLPANGFTLEGLYLRRVEYRIGRQRHALCGPGRGARAHDPCQRTGVPLCPMDGQPLHPALPAQWRRRDDGRPAHDLQRPGIAPRELPSSVRASPSPGGTPLTTAPVRPYADGTEVVNLTATPDTVIDLYAQWSEHHYTIHYHKGA